jgi:predicted amidophosphoribosyltransferase
MYLHDEEFELRALASARFDDNALCCQCLDDWPRWQLPNGICPACRELNTLLASADLDAESVRNDRQTIGTEAGR